MNKSGKDKFKKVQSTKEFGLKKIETSRHNLTQSYDKALMTICYYNILLFIHSSSRILEYGLNSARLGPCNQKCGPELKLDYH